MRTAIICIGMWAVLLGGTPQAQEGATSGGRIYVSFLPLDTVTVAQGHKTPVTFAFRVDKSYHINSNKPLTEELIPTQLHFSLPGEIAIGKVDYPVGVLTSFPFDPTQKLSVYSGDFIIRAMVLAPQEAQAGPLTVHGELRYQACDNNACYPPKKLPISFNVKISPSSVSKKAHGNPQSPHIH